MPSDELTLPVGACHVWMAAVLSACPLGPNWWVAVGVGCVWKACGRMQRSWLVCRLMIVPLNSSETKNVVVVEWNLPRCRWAWTRPMAWMGRPFAAYGVSAGRLRKDSTLMPNSLAWLRPMRLAADPLSGSTLSVPMALTCFVPSGTWWQCAWVGMLVVRSCAGWSDLCAVGARDLPCGWHFLDCRKSCASRNLYALLSCFLTCSDVCQFRNVANKDGAHAVLALVYARVRGGSTHWGDVVQLFAFVAHFAPSWGSVAWRCAAFFRSCHRCPRLWERVVCHGSRCGCGLSLCPLGERVGVAPQPPLGVEAVLQPRPLLHPPEMEKVWPAWPQSGRGPSDQFWPSW